MTRTLSLTARGDFGAAASIASFSRANVRRRLQLFSRRRVRTKRGRRSHLLNATMTRIAGGERMSDDYWADVQSRDTAGNRPVRRLATGHGDRHGRRAR